MFSLQTAYTFKYIQSLDQNLEKNLVQKQQKKRRLVSVLHRVFTQLTQERSKQKIKKPVATTKSSK